MIGFRNDKPKAIMLNINYKYKSHCRAIEIIDQYSREHGLSIKQAVLAIINEYGDMAGMSGFFRQEEYGRYQEEQRKSVAAERLGTGEMPEIKETGTPPASQESMGEKVRRPMAEMETKQMELERDMVGKEENLPAAEPVHKEVLEDAMVKPLEEKKEPEISNISNQVILDMIRKNYS